MLKIYGRKTSSNVMPVLWAADELGLEAGTDYDRIDLGGKFGGNREPDYLAKNPNGLIPTLQDGSFTLWESNSILRFVCTTRGSGLFYPEEPKSRALVEQWMDWRLTTIMPAMTPIFMGLVRTPETERNYGKIQDAIRRCEGVWGLLETHLANHPFLAGDSLSAADFSMGPQIHRWFILVSQAGLGSGQTLDSVTAWYERLKARPGFQRHIMIPIV